MKCDNYYDLEKQFGIEAHFAMRQKKEDKAEMQQKKINRHRFWMCFVDGKDAPKVKHYLLADAKQEAERLAKKTGRDVFVLWASAFVRYIPPTPEMEWQATIVNKEVDNENQGTTGW